MSDKTQDTREELEMDAKRLHHDIWQAGNEGDRISVNHIIELLDRQAAITEREFADGQEIIDEQQNIIELQEKRIYNLNGKVKNLENNYGQLKGSRDHWQHRCKELERMLDDEYIKLPVDADGVRIKLGDILEISRDGTIDIGEVTDIHLQSGKCAVSISFEFDSGVTAYPEDYCHYKTNGVEGLIKEIIREVRLADKTNFEIVTEYSDRIKRVVLDD